MVYLVFAKFEKRSGLNDSWDFLEKVFLEFFSGAPRMNTTVQTNYEACRYFMMAVDIIVT